jgi:hypothetical protein
MTISAACSLALRSKDPVLPIWAAALDFLPVHVHGFVDKVNAAFDASRSTLTGVSSSITHSALVIANYLCLAHDVLAVLVLWLATAIRDIDASDVLRDNPPCISLPRNKRRPGNIRVSARIIYV